MLKQKLRFGIKRINVYQKREVAKINQTIKNISVSWTIISKLLKWFIIVFFGALIIFPFLYMISSALMTKEEALSNDALMFPQNGANWSNFAEAMKDGYWIALLTTALVTSMSVILKVIFSISMGYAFSYKKWKGKNIIWYALLTLMIVPEVALIVGQYKLMSQWNLNIGWGATIAMFLPFIASIFSGFMFRNAFEAIPDRMKEAALADGASEFKYFIKIAVPMASPTTWTVVILTAFAAWNSYMWPNLLVSGDSNGKQVLSTWLFKTGYDDSSGVINDPILYQNIRAAATILVILPMFTAYFLLRTRIMRAISRQGNAIKG